MWPGHVIRQKKHIRFVVATAPMSAERKKIKFHVDPFWNNILTVMLFMLGVGIIYLLKDDTNTLRNLAITLVISLLFIEGFKIFALRVLLFVSKYLIVGNPLTNDTNRRKIVEQSWQFATHATFAYLEYRVLSANDWEWLWKPQTTLSTPPYYEQVHSQETLMIYLAQISIYYVAAVSHRFFEKDDARADYFVMYAHHLATVALLIGSHSTGFNRIGMVVLWIHDVSDIFVDALKIFNYLKLEGLRGWFLTEISFATNLFTWVYFRMYLFPVYVIWRGGLYANMWWVDNADGTPTLTKHMANTLGLDSFKFQSIAYFSMPIHNAMLILLFLMHIYWYSLFMKILQKLLRGGAHQAGREGYEGHSESEDEAASAKAAAGGSLKSE